MNVGEDDAPNAPADARKAANRAAFMFRLRESGEFRRNSVEKKKSKKIRQEKLDKIIR